MRIAHVTLLGFVIVSIIVVVLLLYYKSRENFIENEDLNNIIRELVRLDPIVSRLNFYEGEKSYTINKQNVYICMRDENGKYYDKNFLVYVILHEISHALCNEIGHTQKFMDIFSDLIERASKMGLYNKNAPKVENYCNYRK